MSDTGAPQPANGQPGANPPDGNPPVANNPPVQGIPAPANPPTRAQQQAQFYLNPASAMVGTLDFTDVESRKYFHKATKRLDPDELYDCTPGNMHHFLKLFKQRANENGWDDEITGVLWIPEDHQDANSELRYLPTEYGRRTMSQIDAFEKSYLGAETRAAQDSYMIFKCLMSSLSKEARIKIESWEDEYMVTNDRRTVVPSGNLLLKVIIRESHLDTNATTQSIRMKMSNLDEYMLKINSDITKFNGYVKLLEGSLAARGQRSEALLTHLFKGYLAASDKVFVKYITEKMDRYEEGDEMSADHLMQLADNKFRLLKEREEWDAPSAEEEKLLALQTEVEKLKSMKRKIDEKDRKGSRKAPKRSEKAPKSKGQDKPSWMFKRPTDENLQKSRKWNGKDWWYCGPETGGKCNGEYRRHKPSECQGRAFKGSKDKKKTETRKGSLHNEDRNLKVSEALSTVIEDNEIDTESEDSETYDT